MEKLFIHGPLTDSEVRVAVFGPAAADWQTSASALPGYRICKVAGASFPVLFQDENAAAPGLLLDPVCGEAMERLLFFAGVFDLELGETPVQEQGRRVAVGCLFPKSPSPEPGEPWRPEDWSPDDKAVFLDMCGEIMRCREGGSSRGDASLLKGVSGRALARVAARRKRDVVTWRSGLARDDVRPAGVETPYSAFFAIEEHRLAHRRFDDGWTPELLRAVFVSADASVVLPYDPATDRVLLVEQFRPGPWARGDANPWCLEVVAGRCDQDESAEDTARREAVEEAGITLGRMERIGSYYSSPGAMTEYLTGFIGEADLQGGGGLHGLPSEHEDIRTIVLDRAEAMAAVATGEINNAHTLLPLFYLELHHGRLRAQWTEAARQASP